MAWTRARIEIDRSCDEVFHRVADFAKAEEWDPGVVRGRKLTPGPIREGTAFEIVARFLGRDVPLEYRVAELSPPHRLVLEAETPWIRSVDTITCEPLGGSGEGAALVYEAHLVPKGVLYLGDLGLHVVFQWIGRQAIAGLERWLHEAPRRRRAARADAPAPRGRAHGAGGSAQRPSTTVPAA